MAWMPVDRWFASQAACACLAGGTHRCEDTRALSNLMSARPFGGNDSPVILTGGRLPSGRIAHGKPATRLPDPTRLRFGTTCDGDFWAIEKVAPQPTPNGIVSPTIGIPRDMVDVVKFADTVGRIGNVE